MACATRFGFRPRARYVGAMKERYKELVFTYGWVFVAMLFLTLLVSVALFFVAISVGVDVPGLLERAGWEVEDQPGKTSTVVATLVLSYAAAKVISIPRYALAAVLTPIAARVIQKHRPHWLRQPGAPRDARSP